MSFSDCLSFQILSSPESLGQSQSNLAQNILRCREFNFYQIKCYALFKGEMIMKIHLQHLKIFFTRTTGPISSKLSKKYSLVQGIQVCSNEDPNSFRRGNNFKTAKIHWRNLKIFFSRTTRPFSTKLGTQHPCLKGDSSFYKWRAPLFPRGDNTLTKFKNLFQNHSANFNQTWYKASLVERVSIFFKWGATPLFKGR